ncbi:hypothetical protein PGIGA_G00238690, partial [Pangasianodon gigas]|nr:hypothetical protein [Pangasianodon gigas]
MAGGGNVEVHTLHLQPVQDGISVCVCIKCSIQQHPCLQSCKTSNLSSVNTTRTSTPKSPGTPRKDTKVLEMSSNTCFHFIL